MYSQELCTGRDRNDGPWEWFLLKKMKTVWQWPWWCSHNLCTYTLCWNVHFRMACFMLCDLERFLGTHEWLTDMMLHDLFRSDKDKWTVSRPWYPSRWYSLIGMTKFSRDVQSVCLPSYTAPGVASQKFPKFFRPSNALQSLAHPALCLEMKETSRYHYELAGANVFSFGRKDGTEHRVLLQKNKQVSACCIS